MFSFLKFDYHAWLQTFASEQSFLKGDYSLGDAKEKLSCERSFPLRKSPLFSTSSPSCDAQNGTM